MRKCLLRFSLFGEYTVLVVVVVASSQTAAVINPYKTHQLTSEYIENALSLALARSFSLSISTLLFTVKLMIDNNRESAQISLMEYTTIAAVNLLCSALTTDVHSY